jgi:hypothetical protein
MNQNIDKSWNCVCTTNTLVWDRNQQGFVCTRCKTPFIKPKQIEFKKPPEIIQRVIKRFSKK